MKDVCSRCSSCCATGAEVFHAFILHCNLPVQMEAKESGVKYCLILTMKIYERRLNNQVVQIVVQLEQKSVWFHSLLQSCCSNGSEKKMGIVWFGQGKFMKYVCSRCSNCCTTGTEVFHAFILYLNPAVQMEAKESGVKYFTILTMKVYERHLL